MSLLYFKIITKRKKKKKLTKIYFVRSKNNVSTFFYFNFVYVRYIYVDVKSTPASWSIDALVFIYIFIIVKKKDI